MKKKPHSMVRQVVLIPMVVMLFILLLTIGICVYAIVNMQFQMVDGYESAAKITLNRVDMRLNQIETAFVDYWIYDNNHASLKALPEGTPREDYLVYQTGMVSWMKRTLDTFPEVEGMVVRYPDLDLTQFQGKTNFEMNHFMQDYLKDDNARYNRWQLVELNGNGYLFNIKKRNGFRGGVWIPVREMVTDIGIGSEYPGFLFFQDDNGTTLFSSKQVKGAALPEEQEFIRIGDEFYYLRRVTTEKKGLCMGVLISQQQLLNNVPALSKFILILTVLSISLVPLTVLWLQKRIAQPVSALDKGMRRIGAGDLDYRIPIPKRKTEDEFDYLFSRFNQMMDELNDLEYRLYVTKIRQQQTELKYISQQIRPHFILNALNIIYTYDESEFPLVKKMVLYLSEYFRYIVNLKVDFVEARQELRHVENYLKIQKERYADRFDFVVEWESQAGLVRIPPLLLQTFVENCIKYGMKSEGKTLICVIAAIREDRLNITVMDTGDGYPAQALARLEEFLRTRQPQPELGVGLQNAVERLDALYAENANIRFYNKPTGGAAVEVTLPLTPPEKNPQEEMAECAAY